MSRIYEALLRADLERKNLLDPGATPPAAIAEDFTSVTPAFVLPNILTERVARCEWSPSLNATPCLQEHGAVVEQFRSLRSRLMEARHESPIKTLLISSGMPAEGKSFVALNLAISLARDGVNRVLLIDSDLRYPSLHKALSAPPQPGLSEYLAGSSELPDILQKYKSDEANGQGAGNPLLNITFIPSGTCGGDSSELLINGRLKDLLAALAHHYDWIIIDSPPVLAVTDAIDIAKLADAVLLVAREGRTPFSVAQRAQAAFQKSRLLGIVLNAAKISQRESGYYYSSYYGSDNPKSGRGKDSNAKRGKG